MHALMLGLLLAVFTPRLTRLALALRDDMDADSWRAFIGLGVVAPLALLAAGVAWLVVQSVRHRGSRGWTRIRIDELGITVSDDQRRLRIPWNGLHLAIWGHDSFSLRGAHGERAILQGWWSREGHAEAPKPFMQAEVGELLQARCPSPMRRLYFGLIITLLVCGSVGFAWATAFQKEFDLLNAAGDVECRGMLPLAQGRSEQAAVIARQAPRSSMAQVAHAWALLGDHRAAEALAVADAAMELGEPRFVLGARSRALEALGRPREAARDAAGLIPWQGHVAAMDASRLLSLAGDRDAALRMAQRAVGMRDVPGTRARLREAETM